MFALTFIDNQTSRGNKYIQNTKIGVDKKMATPYKGVKKEKFVHHNFI